MRTRSDKGWGKLPRRIARALAGLKSNDYESRVLWAIVYYTFAWSKPDDWITWGQLSEITGIDQWHLSRPINSLLKKGVIFMKDNRYGVQLDFSKWKTPPIQVVKKQTPPIQEETPPIQEETPPKQVDSLELSPEILPYKVLSKAKERGKERKPSKAREAFFESLKNPKGLKK